MVLVGMGTPAESAHFVEKFKVPFPIVADPHRKLYRRFELKQMSTLGFFSPSLVLKGVTAMAGGHSLGLPQGDVRQLPGVFIINTSGKIVYRHFSSNPADHPDAKSIIAALPEPT